MIRISLKERERLELLRLRLGRSTNIGERAYYVLLSDEGKSAPEIATQLTRNIITIRLWLNRYVAKGIEGLKTKKASGRPSHKAGAIESRLKELLERSPQDYGYQESGWHINLLRDWFDKQGIRACEKTFAKALNKQGYVYKRFSKTMPENAPCPLEKKSKVAEIVSTIRQNTPNEIEILFVDESHFSNQPYVSRGWFKTGEKKQ